MVYLYKYLVWPISICEQQFYESYLKEKQTKQYDALIWFFIIPCSITANLFYTFLGADMLIVANGERGFYGTQMGPGLKCPNSTKHPNRRYYCVKEIAVGI